MRSHSDPIYEVFYGLREQPFAISTDPRFLYLSASHQRAYQELITGLQRGEPLLLLTGEAGTGKTTLSRAVIGALGDRTFSALILNPYMSGGEVLKLILRDFGLISREDLRQGALARAEPSQLLEALEGFLLSIRSVQSRAVVIVDEAQSLAPAALDQVRLLTALERNGQHLIQVIFGGQPKLLETLKKDNMYALNERITRRVHLGPLLAEEVRPYIDHRLAVAGGAETIRFDDDAVQLIAEFSRGLPRRVNLLSDRGLQEGRAENASVITGAMVKRAARSLAGVQRATSTPVPPPGALSMPPAISHSAPATSTAPPAETAEPALPAPNPFAAVAASADTPPPQPMPAAPAPPPSIPAEPQSPFAPVAASAAPAPASPFAQVATTSPFAATVPAPAPPPAAPPGPVEWSPFAIPPSAESAPAPPPVAAALAAAEPEPVPLGSPFADLASSLRSDTSTPAEVSDAFAVQVPARRGRRWALIVVLALLAAAAVFAYGYYAGTLFREGTSPPASPPRPESRARPASPLPIPSDEDLFRSLNEWRIAMQQSGG